jgi:hypothetical protein
VENTVSELMEMQIPISINLYTLYPIKWHISASLSLSEWAIFFCRHLHTVFIRIKDDPSYKMNALHSLQFSGKYQYSH